MINTTYIRDSQESETLLINEVSKIKESKGETIFKFGFGQSPFLPPKYIIDSLSKCSPRKEYVNVQGLQELRQAAAQFHNHYDALQLSADNVIVGPGSKMLIYCILATFQDANVFLMTPSWVSYEPQARLANLSVNRIQTTYESRWRVTPELMNKACEERKDKEKPAILVLNYPGNPDGLAYSKEELQALTQVFKKHNVLVISDEIYGLLNHSGQHQSLAKYYPEGTIVTTGLSKWCGAGGWRLGIALCPKTIEKEFQKTIVGIASETYSCAATPVQYAAINAYQIDSRIDDYLMHQRRILSAVGQFMYDGLKKAGVNVHAPEGGFYLNPDFTPLKKNLDKKGITTSEELCSSLLKDTGVAILPGSAFGYDLDVLVARLAYVDFDGTKTMVESKRIGGTHPLNQEFVHQYCPKIVEGTRRLTQWLTQ